MVLVMRTFRSRLTDTPIGHLATGHDNTPPFHDGSTRCIELFLQSLTYNHLQACPSLDVLHMHPAVHSNSEIRFRFQILKRKRSLRNCSKGGFSLQIKCLRGLPPPLIDMEQCKHRYHFVIKSRQQEIQLSLTDRASSQTRNQAIANRSRVKSNKKPSYR